NVPGDSGIVVCLTVENVYGCRDSICQLLEINNELLLYVPNTILLDGYSHNTIFKPVSNYFHPDYYHLYIFNRWRELTSEITDVVQAWDGTYSHVFVPDRVYVWYVVGAALY